MRLIRCGKPDLLMSELMFYLDNYVKTIKCPPSVKYLIDVSFLIIFFWIRSLASIEIHFSIQYWEQFHHFINTRSPSELQLCVLHTFWKQIAPQEKISMLLSGKILLVDNGSSICYSVRTHIGSPFWKFLRIWQLSDHKTTGWTRIQTLFWL